MKNPDICYTHRTRQRKHLRAELNPMIQDVPRYTGGEMWDRCIYCTYLKGVSDGEKKVKEELLGGLRGWAKELEKELKKEEILRIILLSDIVEEDLTLEDLIAELVDKGISEELVRELIAEDYEK